MARVIRRARRRSRDRADRLPARTTPGTSCSEGRGAVGPDPPVHDRPRQLRHARSDAAAPRHRARKRAAVARRARGGPLRPTTAAYAILAAIVAARVALTAWRPRLNASRRRTPRAAQ